MPLAVILGAGSISNKLNFLRSRCPSPAVIPVNTRPLAAYLIDFYHAQPGCEIRLVVNADVAEVVSAELGGLTAHCSLHPLESSTGVVDSLRQAIRDVAPEVEIIVNVVTTVPTQLARSHEVLLSDQPSQSGHWSGVLLDSGSPRFSFKRAPLPVPCLPFTGILRCPAGTLQRAVETATNPSDLLAVVEQVHRLSTLTFTTCSWIDCGHEINYYEAKAKLIASRSFNRVQVSLDDGVVRKTSDHGKKLKQETDYVEMLPAAIKVYFPRILDRMAATPNSAAFVEMEYYGYPTVAEYLLYWDLSADNWHRLFERLEVALRRFANYPYALSQGSFENFYFGKTSDRVEQFLGALAPEQRRRFESEVTINGRRCLPYSRLKDALRQRLATAYRERDICVMHGDFCFNNILYDVPSGIVRLIDPRGSFGENCVGIYGDKKYDLAKLGHSSAHGYDFIVNGLFTLAQDGDRFDYTIASRGCGPLVSGLFRDLVTRLGQDPAEIELLTSLLFLSMCPLHAEAPRRQLTMYVHGLSLLNRCLEK